MNSNSLRASSETIFLRKLRQEAKIATNILFILDKLESDGLVKVIQQTFHEILDNEITFAVNELTTSEQQHESTRLKTQLVSNTYIFKENLKLIAQFVSFLRSRTTVEGKS